MASKKKPRVGILIGSESDRQVMQGAVDILEQMGIPCEILVRSAHRTPQETAEYARSARKNGLEVLIAGAGMAAHLAGAIAAQTILPVIGVPLSSKELGGQDALFATVQMPTGIPVATVAINGAKNAGFLAAQIIAVNDKNVAKQLEDQRAEKRCEILGQ